MSDETAVAAVALSSFVFETPGLLEIFHQVQKVRKNWEHKKNELFTKQTGNDWSEADGKIHQKLNG